MLKEAYCLKWTGTGRIATKACYTDLERAKEHIVYANKQLSWVYRLSGDRWVIETLEIKEGPKQ